MGFTNYEAYKKRKRNPKLYGFHTFAEPGCPVFLTGPFRQNIRAFLRECGEVEEFNVNGMPIWSTLLINESNGNVVPLYTIEESVIHSVSPFCDHCRCIGWSHHFVSKRRYHFIIPVDEEWNKGFGVEVFDVSSHLLHGLIHCNGFGHLLCINGLEGGSKFLCGREIMDLWDRICITLGARKITVEDTSRKRSMDIRLLYGVAYGHSWFGRWGYKFSHGSFGVTSQNYEAALAALSSVTLDQVVKDFADIRYSGKCIKEMIQAYREVSDTQLITVRDLLRFMLSLKTKTPVQIKSIRPAILAPKPTPRVTKRRRSPMIRGQTKHKRFSDFAHQMDSRWPARRLEYAAEVIVDALKEKDYGMSRQELRDAARLHIGDTGLLDYVIKSINNYSVGDYVVRRTVNSSTKVLEFTVHPIGEDTLVEDDIEELPLVTITPDVSAGDSPGKDVYCDIEYFYQHVLENPPKSALLELAVQVVLDSKHFIKEWPLKDQNDDLLRYLCHILPFSEEIETRLRPPGELIVLPPYATIRELIGEAEEAYRDTYCIMDRFIVKELRGLDYLDDDEVVFGNIESGANIWMQGSGIGLDHELKYERGAENWTVNCTCGAKDDDGERMVSCDMCEVWQHTRCIGIDETESVPSLFLCAACSDTLLAPLGGDYSLDMAECV